MTLTSNDYYQLYTNGIIAPWYLRESQLELYKKLKKQKRVVANCHRRFGKGTTILSYVFERAATERLIIRYGAPTQKQAYDILSILIDHIYYAAPSAKPKLSGGKYTWPSGSVMHVFGVKDESELDKARGAEADIIIADEYGFWKYKPSYVLRSVLSPQLDETDGQLIIASTPPEDLTHPFIMDEIVGAEKGGYLFRWNIDQSIAIGDIAEERHAKIIERCAGTDTDAYKREYKLELIANKSRLVIPEAQNEELYIGSQPRPMHYNWMSCCDLGLKDFFHQLWGYVDFKQAILVIEKEYFVNYQSTATIASACKAIEVELGCIDAKMRRLGDCSDQQQLLDFSVDHEYRIAPILKRSKMKNQGFRESVINQLRILIGQNRLLVSKEGCPMLALQLKYGIWNDKRTDFERTEKLGHLDGLMALAYFVDNADWHTNPYPLLPPEVSSATHFINADMKPNKYQSNQLKKLFG